MIAGLILKDPRRITSARSLTFIDINALTLEALENILDSGDFVETTKLIRRAAIKVALRRTVLEMSRQFREAMQLPPSEKGMLEEWKAEMAAKRSEKKLYRMSDTERTDFSSEAIEEAKIEPELTEAQLIEKRKNTSLLEWWDEQRKTQEAAKEEEETTVVVAQVNTPQLDAVLMRLHSLERTVMRLSLAMERGFTNLSHASDGSSPAFSVLPPLGNSAL